MALADLIRRTGLNGPPWEPEGPWRERLLSLRAAGLDAGDQLRVIEAEGTPADELAVVAKDIYHGAFPHFIGLSRGFRTKVQLLDRDPHLGLWCLATLADPWRVLDILGTQPVPLLQYLLGGWPPARWLNDVALLRLPQELERVLRPEGVVIEAGEGEADLGWLPNRIQGDLRLGPVRVTDDLGPLVLQGKAILRNPRGLLALHQVSARSLVVEDAPDLAVITLDPSTPTVIRRCPYLVRIQGAVGADIHVEDCPGLLTLDILLPRDALPAPSLAIVRCPSLEWAGRLAVQRRVVKNLTLLDNPALLGLRQSLTVRGHRRVEGCHQLVVKP